MHFNNIPKIWTTLGCVQPRTFGRACLALPLGLPKLLAQKYLACPVLEMSMFSPAQLYPFSPATGRPLYYLRYVSDIDVSPIVDAVRGCGGTEVVDLHTIPAAAWTSGFNLVLIAHGTGSAPYWYVASV